MRRAILGVLLGLFFLLSQPILEAGQTRVRGYTTRRGTYVQPYVRTTPNKSRLDNWSTKGNVNPYTGKKGTRNPW